MGLRGLLLAVILAYAFANVMYSIADGSEQYWWLAEAVVVAAAGSAPGDTDPPSRQAGSAPKLTWIKHPRVESTSLWKCGHIQRHTHAIAPTHTPAQEPQTHKGDTVVDAYGYTCKRTHAYNHTYSDILIHIQTY